MTRHGGRPRLALCPNLGRLCLAEYLRFISIGGGGESNHHTKHTHTQHFQTHTLRIQHTHLRRLVRVSRRVRVDEDERFVHARRHGLTNDVHGPAHSRPVLAQRTRLVASHHAESAPGLELSERGWVKDVKNVVGVFNKAAECEQREQAISEFARMAYLLDK